MNVGFIGFKNEGEFDVALEEYLRTGGVFLFWNVCRENSMAYSWGLNRGIMPLRVGGNSPGEAIREIIDKADFIVFRKDCGFDQIIIAECMRKGKHGTCVTP